MQTLNLPPYDVKLRGTREKPEIFDFLRRRFVTLTPEEWVRQHFTHFLVEHKGYPQALMEPRMIIEYKAPTVAITQKVFNQISTYNLLLHVDYLIVSNGLQHYCCRMDYERGQYEFLQDIPEYASLK